MFHFSLYIILLFSMIFGFPKHPKKTTVDYALFSNSAEWSHDYAMGGPSWDCFQRFANNPIYRGHKGMEWPVNGFLFLDPVSKNWYAYIGVYGKNYNTAVKDYCLIYKSSDKGVSWHKVGIVFSTGTRAYDSLKIEAPDVMVTYANGKYNMVFDWGTSDFDWEHAWRGGIGYAEAEKPEGPWIISAKPLEMNNQFVDKPLLKRYWRMYAPMIIKRKNDWVLLFDMDTQPPRSWALVAATSKNPEGPYSKPRFIYHVEQKTYYPPLLEYFPAFIHHGYVYFPATSVSINRNYQYVSRVKIEDVTDPDKYEVFNAGSFWHSIDVPNEYAGIWGQTFTGFVGKNDSLYVMFPSKNKEDYGTINLAKASWNHLYRERGFNFCANGGNSFSFIKKGIDVSEIDVKFELRGTMHLIWDFHTPVDILNGWGKFSLNQNNPNYKEIVINKTGWKINLYNSSGNNVQVIDSGILRHWNENENSLQIKKENGRYNLIINGIKYWEGNLKDNPGVVGIALDSHSYLFDNHFVVSGRKIPGYITYGFYRALVNAGDQDSDWSFKKDDSMFLYNRGAISKRDSSFAKWNFYGKGFSLYSPKGPLFGIVKIYLDGHLLKNISLKDSQPIKSSVIFQSNKIRSGKHAVYIESLDGLLPVDCIRVRL